MDLGSLLLGLALLLVVAFIVARPLIEKRGLREKEFGPADRLLAQRETVLNALRDLDFDHTTGKITAEDYAPQRAELVAQGVAVLKQLDELGVAPNGASASADDEIERAVRARRKVAPRAVDDLIEGEVAARRRARAPAADAVTCPQCGASAQASDKFCPQCGAALSITCPECGRPARPDDKFCAGCGAKLLAAKVA
jgi:hypothetical protein